MPRVDSIVSSITKLVKKLETAAHIHYEDAINHRRAMVESSELSIRHQTEGDRAMAIKTKIESLITV